MMRGKKLIVAPVVFLMIVVTAISGVSTPAQADPACKQVYAVFARGSGEHLNGLRAHQFYWSVKQAVEAQGVSFDWSELGNEDGSVYVDMQDDPLYQGLSKPQPDAAQQHPFDEYRAIGNPWNIEPTTYGDSVVTGTNELIAHLNNRVAKCPNESIVVGGYSQGADVVGWALQRTGYGSLNATTRSHIGYAALYGDPRFDPGSLSQRQQWQRPWWVRGDDPGFRFTSTTGAVVPNRGVYGARQAYVPDEFYGRFGSWCAYRDGICTGSISDDFSIGTHSGAYQDRTNYTGWIHTSAAEIANKVIGKRNQLNPSLPPASRPSYTIAEPDPSVNVPVTVLPRIKSVKRTKDNDGTGQVYAATNSAVTEGWWKSGGDGVHTKEIIHIAQDNIVGFDKTNLPEGKQAVYTAVPDGVWETWWDPSHGPTSAKIITGLTGVRQVIADNRWEGANHDQYVHRLYVLADQGPYEFWWKDGGDGIHKNLLDSITGGVNMVSSTAPNGSYELYVATPTWSYELKWNPGQDFHHRPMINITQGNINSLSKMTVGAEERLFTGTSTGVWQGKWVGDGSPANNPEVNGKVGVIGSQATYTGNAFQIYILTASGVTEFWYTPTNAGNGQVMSRSQGDLTSFTKFNDGAAQQVYTGTINGEVYETYWGGGASPTTKKLFNVNR